MEEQVNEILQKYGYEPVHSYILSKFKTDYEFLSKLFQVKTENKPKRECKTVKHTVVKNTHSTIGDALIVPNKNVPDTPMPVVEQIPAKKTEKKLVLKKIINKPANHDIIENEINDDVVTVVEDVKDVADEDVELIEDEGDEEHVEEDKDSTDDDVSETNDKSKSIEKTSKCKDASKKKLFDKIKAKNAEYKSKNTDPESLLTEENMKDWILTQKKNLSDICKLTGCYPQTVGNRARELGLTTIPKKQQMAIAKNCGRL
jgi:hypothetical protein